MKKKIQVILFFITFFSFNISQSANWCKVIYNKEISPGELQKQLKKCKNSDNFFLAIHTSYSNAGHLLNTLIAESCALNREIVVTEPRSGDPYFSAVCEFRRHQIRE
jgi:hypothetical protein